MTTEWIGVIAMYGLTVLLAIPLGKYLANVFKGEPTAFDFMKPLERLIYRLGGVDPTADLTWKQNLVALLTINLVWFVWAFVLLLFQGSLPLNPDGNPSQTPDLAFNTAISFMVNCDLQHYSGESGATYLTQLAVMMFLMFVSAATGIAAAVLLFRSFIPQMTETVGNFYVLFIKSITRLLLPGSLLIALVLVFNGVPASFDGKDTIISMQGATAPISGAVGTVVPPRWGEHNGFRSKVPSLFHVDQCCPTWWSR